MSDDAPAPAPELAPPPPPPPAPEVAEVKTLFLATADVFGRLAGAVWSLTAAQAAEGGDALKPVPEDPAEREFVLSAWGRAPLVRH